MRNPNGTPDGQVHGLYVISGRSDAKGCNIQQENFAAALAANNVTFRIPTPIFGLGLVEGISDRDLTTAFNSNAALKSQLGISGHFNTSPNDGTITRFGWKAQNKSLLMFSGEAYLVEMGITNELFPNKRDDETTPSCQFNPLPEDMTIFGTTRPSFASDRKRRIRFLDRNYQFFRLYAPQRSANAGPGGGISTDFGGDGLVQSRERGLQ